MFIFLTPKIGGAFQNTFEIRLRWQGQIFVKKPRIWLIRFPLGLPYRCSFEFDFCGMIQRQDDQYDWARRQGTTETGDTGPVGTLWGSVYIYAEGSSPRAPNDRAVWVRESVCHNCVGICRNPVSVYDRAMAQTTREDLTFFHWLNPCWSTDITQTNGCLPLITVLDKLYPIGALISNSVVWSTMKTYGI